MMQRLHLVNKSEWNSPCRECIKCGMLLIGKTPAVTIEPNWWSTREYNCERVGPPPAKTITLVKEGYCK